MFLITGIILSNTSCDEWIREDLQSHHQAEIASKDGEIKNIEQERQSECDRLRQEKLTLSANAQLLEMQNDEIKSENVQIVRKKQDIIKSIEDGANQIESDIHQWIADRQSVLSVPPKSNLFRYDFI